MNFHFLASRTIQSENSEGEGKGRSDGLTSLCLAPFSGIHQKGRTSTDIIESDWKDRLALSGASLEKDLKSTT